MKIGFIGAGSWGTALANVVSDNGHEALIYTRNKLVCMDINTNNKNISYLGDDILLNSKILATTNLKDVFDFAEIIVLSVPSSALKDTLIKSVPFIKRKTIFVNTAKGFDLESGLRLSDLIRNIIPQDKRYEICSLLGPSHAEEVVEKQLTCICSVSLDDNLAKQIQELFSNEYFRVYRLNDEIGAEIGAAVKNPIAIASGILSGLGYKDNAKAALITRGLKEIISFGKIFGANESTFFGLTGLGDLMVTCNSHFSRNFKAGYLIGVGNDSKEFLTNNNMTVEGIKAVKVLHKILKENSIKCPIIEGLYTCLFKDVKPKELVKTIMLRPLIDENR